jgi:glycine/D-amino acid oxidase-like deaminating enzyme
MVTDTTAEIVICGAGIAGVSAAYHLCTQFDIHDILLVDEGPPLSLTSDKSTECYRNWWPGPGSAMVDFMNRSIDLLEEVADSTGNVIHLNRRGYLFATADPRRVDDFRRTAEEAAELGAGSMRLHSGAPGEAPYEPPPPEGFHGQPTGADLITDPRLLRGHFAYLSPETIAVVHARRAGWFSAQQLGAHLLAQARQRGVRLENARVAAVRLDGDRVSAVDFDGPNGHRTVSTRCFVIAAGPYLRTVGQMIGVELPVFSEHHAKVAIPDRLGVVPRDAPLLIWSDEQRLPWSDEEKQVLAESQDTRWLLGPFPQRVHARPEGPEGSPMVLILWTYHTEPVEPVFPPPADPDYPEIAVRGLATMIPGLRQYFDRLPRPSVDGGYYTKTQENRPLIGPLPVQGAYVIGALSGYGLMASMAAGELVARHIVGGELPSYAAAFRLERYDDPSYQELLKDWGTTGQL